jgi:GDP-4-dehydro-6-deoxy-D-mannose reductase
LITGINGFVGPYTAEHILQNHPDSEVWGMAWGEEGLEQLRPLQPRLQVLEGDLTDPRSLVSVLQTVLPDMILHLAAASSVASSWESPATCLSINAIGQINLLESLRSLNLSPRIVISSSAEVYGKIPEENLPVREDHPLRPVSPYGVSKATQDLLAYQYHVAHGMEIIRLRLFNHTGPRRPALFFASSFSQQIAEIEKGIRPPRILHGDLEVTRDLSDVRDVARAYWLAARQGTAGEAYNVCSGVGVTIRSVLEELLALTNQNIEVIPDPERFRRAEIPVLYGDRGSFSAATGWAPSIPLRQTLKDLLNWWRSYSK